MADSFQQALGQRLLDISRAIKKLRQDFITKDEAKGLDSKISQNKVVLAETNKKIKELEINIKKLIDFTNGVKQNSASKEELHEVHDRQDKLLKDYELYKQKTENSINYTYNDIIGVFRKFKVALLSKEKKDIVHLEKIYSQFSKSYLNFQKQTKDYELTIDRRIIQIKNIAEKDLKANFLGFKEEMISAVKKLRDTEGADSKALHSEMTKLKSDLTITLENFQKTTENYLYNLDHEIDTYVKKLRSEMKLVDIHAGNQNNIVEKRMLDVKKHIHTEMITQKKELDKLRDALIGEKKNAIIDYHDFKEDFQQEFNQLSANLSNLNDVQIKLSKDDVLHRIDEVGDKFHDTAENKIRRLHDDLLHAEADNDKLKSRLKKMDDVYGKKFKKLEEEIKKLKKVKK